MFPLFKTASSFLSRIWNRQLLVFFIFLVLSTAFWFFTAGKEVKEKEFDVQVELVGVPKNVVITTDPPKKITVTLRDEVFTLVRYMAYSNTFKATINWANIDTSSGHVKIATSTLLKAFYASLHNTTKIVGQRPDTIEFYYNYGRSKTVNAVFQGIIQADSTYHVTSKDISPRKVEVFGSKAQLDTITGAYLQPVNLRGLNGKKTMMVYFKPVKGVKFVPEYVTLTVTAHRIMEKTVPVPVRGVNFPAGKTLRTFPPKVNVTFLVSENYEQQVGADNFAIVLTYADLINKQDNRAQLQVKSLPTGVKNARVTPAEVEFIIEDDNNEDSEDTEPAAPEPQAPEPQKEQ